MIDILKDFIMFSLTYKKIKNEYSSETIILNSPELKPIDETYINMYMDDETQKRVLDQLPEDERQVVQQKINEKLERREQTLQNLRNDSSDD
jgi:hypothetical protein